MACATAVSGFNFSYMFIYKYCILCIVQRTIYATSATSIKVQVLTTYRMSVLCGVLYKCTAFDIHQKLKLKGKGKHVAFFLHEFFRFFFYYPPSPVGNHYLLKSKDSFVQQQN